MQFNWASRALDAIILTAVLSCLNSAFYVCSRVLFVLAEHGDAPQWLVQVNARRVPTRSVWMGSIAGVLGILAAITSSQTVFAFLVNASGALVVFIYMIIALAHIRLRRAREASGAHAAAGRAHRGRGGRGAGARRRAAAPPAAAHGGRRRTRPRGAERLRAHR